MNDRTTPVQTVARLVGIVFLLVGIAGFIPGITTNLYDGLEFAGDNGNAELLGLFQVSVLHNIVHALFAIGILMAATPQGARTFLLGSGAIYIVLFVLGIQGFILALVGEYLGRIQRDVEGRPIYLIDKEL